MLASVSFETARQNPGRANHPHVFPVRGKWQREQFPLRPREINLGIDTGQVEDAADAMVRFAIDRQIEVIPTETYDQMASDMYYRLNFYPSVLAGAERRYRRYPAAESLLAIIGSRSQTPDLRQEDFAESYERHSRERGAAVELDIWAQFAWKNILLNDYLNNFYRNIVRAVRNLDLPAGSLSDAEIAGEAMIRAVFRKGIEEVFDGDSDTVLQHAGNLRSLFASKREDLLLAAQEGILLPLYSWLVKNYPGIDTWSFRG